MKKATLLSLLALIMTLSSCEVIGGIFKAGMWSGVIMVVLVIGIIIFILSRVLGGRK